MDLMLLKNYKIKLKASSTLETIIATAIISICLVVAVSVYTSAISSTKTISEIKLESKVNNIFIHTQLKKAYSPEVYHYQNTEIIKRVKKLNEKLIYVEIIVVDKTKEHIYGRYFVI